jgi:hypothetical protein
MTEKIENIKIEDLKPSDREKGYPLHVPRWYTRILEMIPGLATWTLLFLPIIAALAGYPQIIVVYVSFLTIYWSTRGLRFAYGLIVGNKRMKRDLARDWMADIAELNKPLPKYVYILPLVKEGLDVIDPALEMFANQEVGAERISIVFALEEKFTDVSIPNAEKMIEKYNDQFAEMYYSVHPYGIEGEVVGVKGANINWATREFYKKLLDRNEDPKDYLLITNDSDLRPHPKYLSSITYRYLTSDKPMKKYYCTAVHTFNNNIWRVPPINRIFSHSLTLAIFHSWVVEPHLRETWSAYVVNLQTVHDVGYWDPTIGIDDTPFYWNARIRFKGDFSGEEVYIPTYNDAVENETFVKSHTSLYKQQHRWGWGIIVFPMTFATFYKNKDLSIFQKTSMALKLIHNQLLFLTVVYTITFALPLLGLFSPEYQYSSASHNLNQAMRFVLTGLMFLNIPIYIIRKKLTPLPKDWSWWRRILDFFEIILITVNMLTFGFIPKIHAQTQMLLNIKVNKYYATEKVAIKKS